MSDSRLDVGPRSEGGEATRMRLPEGACIPGSLHAMVMDSRFHHPGYPLNFSRDAASMGVREGNHNNHSSQQLYPDIAQAQDMSRYNQKLLDNMYSHDSKSQEHGENHDNPDSRGSSEAGDLDVEGMNESYQESELSEGGGKMIRRKGEKPVRLCINARERRRMHDLNDALDELRSVIPYAHSPSVRKLSKIATMLLAKNFILMQANALEEMRRLVTYMNQAVPGGAPMFDAYSPYNHQRLTQGVPSGPVEKLPAVFPVPPRTTSRHPDKV